MKIPLIKFKAVHIKFELTDDNIESYRETCDNTVPLVFINDDETRVLHGGDLCDMLYDLQGAADDECVIWYADNIEVKNCDDEDNLALAAVEAYACPDDCEADNVDEAYVCIEDVVCFKLEDNEDVEDISQEEFDVMWDENL